MCRKETFDRGVFSEMGQLGMLGGSVEVPAGHRAARWAVP